MEFEELVTVEKDHQGRNLQICLAEQQAGVAAGNACRISGENNRCAAGSTMTYAGEKQSIDAYILCPLDAVEQSKFIEGTQKGLCSCESQLYDESCSLIESDMECECFACPFGMALGFAYSCTSEIVGPCKSFDCMGRCNEKYDPGNLLDRETFAPSTLGGDDDTTSVDGSSSNKIMMNNHFMGTAFLVAVLLRKVL